MLTSLDLIMQVKTFKTPTSKIYLHGARLPDDLGNCRITLKLGDILPSKLLIWQICTGIETPRTFVIFTFHLRPLPNFNHMRIGLLEENFVFSTTDQTINETCKKKKKHMDGHGCIRRIASNKTFVQYKISCEQRSCEEQL